MKKAVFVTGGTVGSGYAIAERYGKEGYYVVITSRDGGRAGSAAERIAKTCGVSAYGYALDIRDEQRVKDIFADLDVKGVFVETVCLNSADMGKKQIVNGDLTPIGDISDFEDIANAAWYLGSDGSKNVTGTEITVDGGMSCQLYPQILNELKHKNAGK